VAYFVNNPMHWRERAKEARSVAVSIDDPIARESMLSVAEAYERMAARAEEHPIIALNDNRY
jgi:hypothetical protein